MHVDCRFFCALVGAVLVVAACSEDEDAGASRDAGGTGGGAPADGSASGGSVTGDATSPVPTGMPTAEAGPNGSPSCPEDGECRRVGGFEACCTTAGYCGARYFGAAGAGCVRLDQEGRVDPTCPTNGETTGCCRPTNTCGAFYSQTFGCVDPADLLDRQLDMPVPCSRYPMPGDGGGD